MDVFEHVDDYVEFIRDLRSLGRKIIFRIPLDMNVLNVAFPSRILALRQRLGHLHYFSETTAIATIQYCGCSVVDSVVVPPVSKGRRGLGHVVTGGLRRLIGLISPSLSVRLLGGGSLLVLASSDVSQGADDIPRSSTQD
jgi:hypothetical protein